MKQPKKPTRTQKEAMEKAGLVWKSWSVVEETDTQLHLISKRSGQRRTIDK